MTRAEILALPAQINPRLYKAEDTQEFFLIAKGEAGSLATIIPANSNRVDRDDLRALERTAAEGQPANTAYASQVLTFGANPADSSTVTIDGVVYTFRSTASQAYDVQIDGTLATTIANLATSINSGDGFGGTAHPTVGAASDATTLTATADALGEAGNSIAVAEDDVNLSWAGATLVGGIDALVTDIVGKWCRVGDASPFTWYRWNGTVWNLALGDENTLAQLNSFLSDATLMDTVDDDTFTTASATTVPTSESVKAYVDAVAVAAKAYQGGYNATTNSPDLTGTPGPIFSPITSGDVWDVTTGGTFFGETLEAGDTLIARVDSPTVLTDWVIVQTNIDFTNRIDLGNRDLLDGAGRPTVDWDDKLLYAWDGSQNRLNLDWGNRAMNDASSFTSIHWGNRLLYASSTRVSVNWDSHTLQWWTGAAQRTVLDWSAQTLYDSGGGAVLDWSAGQLVSGGTVFADWVASQILYSNSGSYHNPSVDWGSRQLRNGATGVGAGDVMIDWSHEGAPPIVQFPQGYIGANITQASIDLSGRTLIDSGGAIRLDWSTFGAAMTVQNGNLDLSGGDIGSVNQINTDNINTYLGSLVYFNTSIDLGGYDISGVGYIYLDNFAPNSGSSIYLQGPLDLNGNYLHYASYVYSDAGSTLSADFNGRVLYDSSGEISAEWANRRLLSGSGIYSVPVLDWSLVNGSFSRNTLLVGDVSSITGTTAVRALIGGGSNTGNSCSDSIIWGSAHDNNTGQYCAIFGQGHDTNTGTHCAIFGNGIVSNSATSTLFAGQGHSNNSGTGNLISGGYNASNSNNYNLISGANCSFNSGNWCLVAGSYHGNNSGDYNVFGGLGVIGNFGQYNAIFGSPTSTAYNVAKVVSGVTGSNIGDTINSFAHGLAVGDPIRFTTLTGGTGLSLGIQYYVSTVPDGNTFTVTTTINPVGPPQPITADYSSVAYIAKGANYGDHNVIGGNNNWGNTGTHNAIFGQDNYRCSGSFNLISGGGQNLNANRDCTGSYNSISGAYNFECSGSYNSISGSYNQSNSGDYNIIGGSFNNANSGLWNIIAGSSNTSNTGNNNAIFGSSHFNHSGFNSLVVGDQHSNIPGTSINSVISGRQAYNDKYGARVHASGNFASNGDAQNATYVMRRQVTHNAATWFGLGLDGADPATTPQARLTVATNQIMTFDILITGATSGLAKKFGFKIVGAIANDGGTTAIMASSVTTIDDSSDTSFDVRVTADDTNDQLLVEVSDADGTGDTVRWVAVVNTVQLTYA